MATPRKASASSAAATQQPLLPAVASSNANNNAAANDAEKGSSVQVVVRCRPPNEREKANGDTMVVGCYPSQNEIRVVSKKAASSTSSSSLGVGQATSKTDTKTYTFDATYGGLSTQEEVYTQTVRPLVDEVLGGFNCTVFAYGQTGTGKTHTMEGELGSSVTANSGVIPRAVHTIFEQLAEKKFEDYNVKLSCMEIYNEELADLLSEAEEKPSSTSSSMGGNSNSANTGEAAKELRIFEDPSGKKGMMVMGLEEAPCASALEVFALLTKANKKRRVAETNMNARSSRSHYVFTITVFTKVIDDGEDIIKTGKLYLVDLAGSECIKQSGAKDARAKEAGKINQSLLTLGRVINALVDRASFIPYRDSKLTRLLQESLGGRAKTVIIATVSPSHSAFDETLSTLDYAHRAKSIKNKPQVNAKMTKRAYMKELLAEIASLKRDNEVLRSKNGIIIAPEKYERMMAEEKGKSMQLDELLFKIKQQDAAMETVQAALAEKEAALTLCLEQKAELTMTLAQTVELLDSTNVILSSTRAQLFDSQALLIQFQRQLHAREIELENSSAMVDAQRLTEYRLTQQTLQVLSALETTLGAKQALHEKIDRKAGVEEHNAAAAQVFHTRIGEQITQIAQGEAAMQQDTQVQIDSARSSVDEISAARAEQRNALASAQGTFDSSIRAQSEKLQDEVSSFQTSHIDTINTAISAGKTFHADRAVQFASIQSNSNAAFTSINQTASAIQGLTITGHAAAIATNDAAKDASIAFVRTAIVPAITKIGGDAQEHSTEAVQASEQCATVLASFKQTQSARVAQDAQTLHERIAAMQAANTARINELAAANAAKVAEMMNLNAARIAKLQQEQDAAAIANAAHIAKVQAEQAAVAAANAARVIAVQEQQAAIAIADAARIAQVQQEQAAIVTAQAARIAKAQEEQAAIAAANAARITRVQEEQAAIAIEDAARIVKLQEEQAAAMRKLQQEQAAVAVANAARITKLQEEQAAIALADAARITALQEEQAAIAVAEAARIAKVLEEQAAVAAANAARVTQLQDEQAAIAAADAARVAQLQQEQSSLIARLQSEMVQTTAAVQSELVASSCAMQTALVASVESMQIAFSAEVNALIEAHQSSQIALLHSSVADVTSRVVNMAASENSAIQQLQSSVAGVHAVASSFVEAVEQRTTVSNAAATEAQSILLSQQGALASSIEQSKASIHASLDSCVADNVAREQHAIAEAEQITAVAAQFVSTQQASIAQSIAQCEAQSASVSAWISDVQSADAAASSKLHGIAFDISSRLVAHNSSFTAGIQAATATVDSFVRAELRRDISLGSTPQKGANVTYPAAANLARTASPGSVVSHFRAEHPVRVLAFEGLIEGIEGIDELVKQEVTIAPLVVPSVSAPMDTIAVAAPIVVAPISAAPAAVAIIEPVRAASPINVVEVAVAASKRPSNGVGAAAIVPLPAEASEEDDTENAKPAAAQPTVAAAAIDIVEKPAAAAAAAAAAPAKRPTRLAAAAATTRVSAATSAKNSSRLRMPTTSFGEAK